MSGTFAWGILGTGGIAKALARAVNASTTSELVAVGSRSQESADKFGDEFNIPRRYASYDAVLADPQVQVVYLALPNDIHAEWAMRCARAGKHILCEKPLASNYPEAMALIEAIRDEDVFLLEAFMYRCHPQTAKIVELVKSKIIGDVRLMHINFSFNFGEQPDNIRSKASMSGGGIMDVGCYTMTFARIVAGAALGLDGPAEPREVKGSGHLHPVGGVDTWATASLKFPGDILATLTCGMQLTVPAPQVIYGTEGRMVVHNPWFPGETDDATKIEVFLNNSPEPQVFSAPGSAGLYTIEVDTVTAHLQDRQAPSPAMTWADSLGNAKALDQWRQSIGLVFGCETPEGMTLPASRQPLAVMKSAHMPMGNIVGVSKPVSRIILGTMSHVIGDLPKTFAMLDRFVEYGGNTLDTALVYGSEARVGQWIKARGIREQIVFIGKGAASIDATPQMVTDHLLTSLERAQMDYFDVYMMHRDNTKVPVGEFVEVMNEHLRAGRIRAFGGSNWTIERLQAANEYAAQHGLTGFSAASPNFTLATWNEPMWADCVAANNAPSRKWYAETGMPLLAWSSQANGFFTGRYPQSERDNPAYREIVRVWYNDANFARLQRVQELCTRRGITGAQAALAYVLCQPLNIYAMIGPETMDEMRASMSSLDVRLTPEELAWLNLEIDAIPVG